MANAQKLTATLSREGKIKLPKSVRDRCKWAPGAELLIEETADGVLLRRTPLQQPTTIDDVFGMLKYSGPPVTIEDMDAAIATMAHSRARD